VQDHRSVSELHQGLGKGESLEALSVSIADCQSDLEFQFTHDGGGEGRSTTYQRTQTGPEPSNKNESYAGLAESAGRSIDKTHTLHGELIRTKLVLKKGKKWERLSKNKRSKRRERGTCI
jgi:hypothetical protein